MGHTCCSIWTTPKLAKLLARSCNKFAISSQARIALERCQGVQPQTWADINAMHTSKTLFSSTPHTIPIYFPLQNPHANPNKERKIHISHIWIWWLRWTWWWRRTSYFPDHIQLWIKLSLPIELRMNTRKLSKT